jgi:hypothetical protein
LKGGGQRTFGDSTWVLVEAGDDGDMARPGLGGRAGVADPPPPLLLDHATQERRPVPPPLVWLIELVRPEPVRCTQQNPWLNHTPSIDEEDEGGLTHDEDDALGGRRGEAGRHGRHAVHDGGLEVDVEYAEHVHGVEGDAEHDQPPLAPPRGGRRRVRLRALAVSHCGGGTGGRAVEVVDLVDSGARASLE